jgi:hypothetical protein
MADELTLDANAVGGLLVTIFGADVTAARGRCAHCGNEAAMATLRAYTRGPGVVLRCSICGEIAVRIAPTRTGSYRVDLRGTAWLELTAD